MIYFLYTTKTNASLILLYEIETIDSYRVKSYKWI